MKLIPRKYQVETCNAIHNHICTKDTNPCAVIPTGGGKSPIMAWMIERWKRDYPWFRCCILAHRKELIVQNAAALSDCWPEADIGIYSAALKKRDEEASILYAAIDSIYKRAGEFTPFDVILVDEAHRIPPKGEGKYRSFIKECKAYNPRLRVVGFTATPYRMGCGNICHRDHILNEICYEAHITDLINDGYLSPLKSKVGIARPDLEKVRSQSSGDYILKSLSQETNKFELVSAAVAEAVYYMNAEDRKSTVFFCVDIEHCKLVSAALRMHGIHAPYVTGKTKNDERDRIVRSFKSGHIRAVCNVNVFTEGFDVPRIDCVVLLRPTLSPGLFFQMVGRGLRLSPQKVYCRILDFAGCIDEHGPVDLLGNQPVAMATCVNCRESFSRAVGCCPACGWEIPKPELERLEKVEREKRLHSDHASKRSILSDVPETHEVNKVYVNRHVKYDGPDSLRVQYGCGETTFTEWICLDHDGPIGTQAQVWWRNRFQVKGNHRVTVDEACEDMFLAQALNEWTKTVTVRRDKKYWRVIDYNRIIQED
jgi:DNA repair protein RadD